MPNDPLQPDVQAQVYLAAERTFLSWIRTGLALMGFGFVVARFGLFLRELDVARAAPMQQHAGAVRFGTALVILGVVLTAAAVARYRRLIHRLTSGDIPRAPSSMAVSLGLALAVLGAAVAVYLLLTP